MASGVRRGSEDEKPMSGLANHRAQSRMLADGRRLHLHDGPIDLIVEAFGLGCEVERAYHAAGARFVTVLDELCSELARLRKPCSEDAQFATARPGDLVRPVSPRRPTHPGVRGSISDPGPISDGGSVAGVWPRGAVARRMVAATTPYAAQYFLTPMAAVAGAVAEEILAAMVSAAELARAYVNDGGDIALHLSPGEKFVVGMVDRPDRPSLVGTTTLHAADPVRGIATSGWRGRSFSLGIADAVTVLGDRAAAADAAATIIANAVDLPGHPAVIRVAACQLSPDSDLGQRAVTQAVGSLTKPEVDQALAAGVVTARQLLRMGLIRSAALHLQGQTQVVGDVGKSETIAAGSHERTVAHA